MIRAKFLAVTSILMLLCQTTALTVSAEGVKSTDPTTIAFLDPTDSISLYTEDMTSGWPVYIANESASPVQLQVYIVGMDILQADVSAKTLAPGEVLRVNFSLISGRISAGKTYSGYIVFSDQSGNTIDKAVTIHAGSKAGATSADQTLPTQIDQIATQIQFAWQKLTRQQVRFGPPEWSILAILVALALYGLIWLFRGVQYLWWDLSGSMGPVYIEEIKDKPALTASLRHHLSHCGLHPRLGVPNTSIGLSEFNDMVSKSKLPEAAFFQAILVFLQNGLGRNPGYVVTVLLPDEASKTTDADKTKEADKADKTEEPTKTSVNIEIKLAHTGKVQFIETIEDDSPEDAMQQAAHYIFHRISSRKTALARWFPEWVRFPTAASFHKYKCATELKVKGKCEQAIELYKDAAKEAPFNALLLMGLGDTYELNSNYPQAIEVYLRAVAVWPHLYTFWYRIAIDFSYEKEWLKKAGNIKSNIRTVFNSNHPPEKLEKWSGRRKKIQGWLVGLCVLELIIFILGILIVNHFWRIPGIPGIILGDVLGGILGLIIATIVDITVIGIKNKSLELKENKQKPKEKGKNPSQNQKNPPDADKEVLDFLEQAGKIYDFLKNELNPWEAISNWRFWRGVNWWHAIFKPVEYMPGLTRYLWNYISIPRVGWGSGAQLSRITALAALNLDVIRASKDKKGLDSKVIEDKVDFVISNNWWNRSDVYYDAACVYARLSEYHKKRKLDDVKEKAVKKALDYLKRSTRGQHPLEVTWTRTDPDLASLHDIPEFQALFGVQSETDEQEKKKTECEKTYAAMVLLQKVVVQHSNYWKNPPVRNMSLVGLLGLADSQVRLWTSLQALADKPTDQELQESFKLLADQKDGPAQTPHKPEETTKLPGQDKLDEGWKFIKTCSQTQLEIWKERQADCKSALKHAQVPMPDVWDQWSKAEKTLWEYVEERIKGLI